MAADQTVVFADLTGSSRIFEAVGNARATETVTRLIQWVGAVCESHTGRVVKTMGDGLFAVFEHGNDAARAVVELQRGHDKRLRSWPIAIRMELQIGVATGAVVEVEADVFGDAVNTAARLSQMAGPGEIWVTEAMIAALGDSGIKHRDLGPLTIRGKSETPVVHCIDWKEDQSSFLTMPATLSSSTDADSGFGNIELSWLDQRASFSPAQLPVHLGRVVEADFVVDDPRVSRLHARIESRQGGCMLIDTSTYGTWVRFHGAGGSSNLIALRREECMLHGSGEIGLGAPLNDFSAPTISFSITAGELTLGQPTRLPDAIRVETSLSSGLQKSKAA